ncbi:MAG: aminomethyl-transferring glycine dehydrogenase subunit GcvPB [Anaerolineae bacterium]|nr:aminomethyl-transferring glycine dehydrogenase subunit GcvPB [Anaerolineae bacterium]
MWQSPEPLLFEMSSPGRTAFSLPELDVPETPLPNDLVRDEVDLPEISELELVRHYLRLSQKNFSIDTHFYPLGSCTMKYNPKVNETAAGLEGFARTHPFQPEEMVQGNLELMYRLQEALKEIAGFAGISLQPAAGAHGEFAGVLIMRAYHLDRGDTQRIKMLIPDSAHGTNPASVAMSGFEAVEIPSDQRGNVDLAALKAACNDTVVGLMLTNPNTLGLFEEQISEVIDTIHACGGLVYGDGANLNALMGVARPGDLGFDVMHFNLHKTFTTPHGGGGPGSGPVGVNQKLAPFLPGPIVNRGADEYRLVMPEKSIGRLKAFHGNFGMLIRAFTYVMMMGEDGLREATLNAVLNANYLKARLEKVYPVKYNRTCMHEFVAMGNIADSIHTMDIAKRLIDYGFHPPTVYFPLIVHEALMIEPTETESKETLDRFVDALLKIAEEARNDPDLLHTAPHTTPVTRLDEVSAARKPVLCFKG